MQFEISELIFTVRWRQNTIKTACRSLHFLAIFIPLTSLLIILSLSQCPDNTKYTMIFNICIPFKLDLEKAKRNQRSNCQQLLDHRKSKRVPEKTCALLTMSKPLCVSQHTGKFFKRWDIRPPDLPPEKSVCRSGSNRTGHGTTDWFQIGKGVCQGCIFVTLLI